MTEAYVYNDEVMNTTDLKDQPHRMSHSVRRRVGGRWGKDEWKEEEEKERTFSSVLTLTH